MFNATLGASMTDETVNETAPDPSMAMLAPTSTRRRNLLLALAGFALLAAAWLSPALLRPSVVPANGAGAGSWHALPSNRQVLTMTQVTARTWPNVELRSVVDVPGADVAGTWMIDDAVLAGFDDAIEESAFDSGEAYLRAAMPAFDTGADSLPRRLGHGQSAILVVLWNVAGCDVLDTPEPVPAPIELGTVIRTGRREELPPIAAPGFDVDTLRRSGTCG